MQDHSESKHFPDTPDIPRFGRRDAIRAVATVVLACASFTAAGAACLLVFTALNPDHDFIRAPAGLALRAILFSILSLAALGVMARVSPPTQPGAPPSPPAALSRRDFVGLACLLGAIALLLGGRLGDYPWAAPDEIHHLVVAKNLAEHGAYASGHPAVGLNYFDSFDSVGPAVLGPVALAFKVFGTSIVTARAVIAAFFLGLCLALFSFTRPLFGSRPAFVAVSLLLGTYSSLYLGRTLYGEVPALFFLVLSLIAWRRALASPGLAWGVAAGFLGALCLLSKMIFALALFCVLAAWCYDRATVRVIRIRHVAAPAVGAAATLALWAILQRFHGPQADAEGGVFAIYQHYLIFGVSGFARAFANGVLRHPFAHLGWLAIALLSAPLLFRRRHDPPATVLYLFALFTLYWWLFFTPGQLHRYLWSAYAILAIFSAPWVCWLARRAWSSTTRPVARGSALAMALFLTAPQIHWFALQAREIRIRDEMVPERALADAVRALPAEARIVTDTGRVPGVLNFLADRPARWIPDRASLFLEADAVVAAPRADLAADLPEGWEMQPAGAFMLLCRTHSTE